MAAGPRRRTASLLLVVVAVASSLTGCSGDADHRVVVYSGRPYELVKPVLDRFSADTGIAVEYRQGESAALALTIQREGAASPADVFISQSTGPVAFLAKVDRLEPVPQTVLDRVAEGARAEGGTWIGQARIVRVLVSNTDLGTATAPGSAADLTSPRYQSQVGVAPSSGSFDDFISAMRIQSGDDAARAWLADMVANGVRTFPTEEAVVAAVARGEVRYGLVDHDVVARSLAERPTRPLASSVLAGDAASVELLSAVGILSGAPHIEDAERLVAYLLSDEEQQAVADDALEYPVVESVAPAEALAGLASDDALVVDTTALGLRFTTTESMIRDSGIAA